MPLKITLDSNCIINLLDHNSPSPTSLEELRLLVNYAMESKLDIAITTRLYSDIDNDKNAERKSQLKSHLILFPVVGTILRTNVSKFNLGDKFCSENEFDLAKDLERVLFPTLDQLASNFGNKINDIDHLVGHHINKRDIFVTDDKGILRKRETLKNSYGILVMNPHDCLIEVEKSFEIFAPRVFSGDNINSKYINKNYSGLVTFDYSNNDGRYSLGDGHYYFETSWSKASDKNIHAYRDPESISCIALVKSANSINEIGDKNDFDFSSRSRRPKIGEIVIWKNINGVFAATKILSIKDDSRNDTCDEVTFEYEIFIGDQNVLH